VRPDERELIALEDEAERLRAGADRLLGEVIAELGSLKRRRAWRSCLCQKGCECTRSCGTDKWERRTVRRTDEIDLGEWVDER
jgi:hypothetical protein